MARISNQNKNSVKKWDVFFLLCQMTKKAFKKMDGFDERLIEAVRRRKNIFLHGPGGVGKSYTLRGIASYLSGMGIAVYCTATTGVAALNLNIPEKKISASTLHSWAGVGLARENAEKLLAKVECDSRSKKRWLETDTLIIDEVSMLGASFFEKLDFIGRNIRTRQKYKTFGGIQLILSGDFLQLPPVKDDWVFSSEAWKKMKFVPFILETPKRYDDNDFFQLLLRVRKGDHTKADMKKLRARTRAYGKLQTILQNTSSTNIIRPTIMYSKKVDVNSYNEQELEKLPGDVFTFIAQDTFTPLIKTAREEKYIRLLEEVIPDVISLKVGAQIMLRCNFDVSAGLVNGSRGVVLSVDNDSIFVRFINGKKLNISRNTWSISDKEGVANRSQIPFILAWSLTIHKSQGATLDYAICDLGPSIFSPGQAYVALSRVKNLKGLFICDFYSKCIGVDKDALKYSKKLEKMEQQSIEGGISSEEEENFSSDDEDCDSEIDESILFECTDSPLSEESYIVEHDDENDIRDVFAACLKVKPLQLTFDD